MFEGDVIVYMTWECLPGLNMLAEELNTTLRTQGIYDYRIRL